MKSIKKQHLVEVRSMGNPPPAVKLALESICLLLGEQAADWRAIRGVIIKDNFISTVVNFSTEDISYVEQLCLPFTISALVACGLWITTGGEGIPQLLWAYPLAAFIWNKRKIKPTAIPGLSLRGRGWGFSLATMSVSPSYFCRKQKENRTNWRTSLLYNSPTNSIRLPGNVKCWWQPRQFLAVYFPPPTNVIYPGTWNLSDRPVASYLKSFLQSTPRSSVMVRCWS